MKLRLLGLALLVGTTAAPAFADDPSAKVGNDYFAVSDTHQQVATSTSLTSVSNPSAAASQDETETTGSDVVVTHRLACGDSDSNLQIDSFVCESALMRCGEGNRGFIYYATSTEPDGSSEAAGSGCYLPQDVEAAVAAGALPAVAAPPRITPGMVLRAFERVPLPESELVVQPPGGETLVGLDTIFSTEAEPFTETVSLLGRSVELEITPSTYRWSHGDDTGQTTDWPGRPWSRRSEDYVSHAYEDRMQVSTSVDTTWSARFRVDGGAWEDVPGAVTIDGEPSPLEVRSATPRLVGAADR